MEETKKTSKKTAVIIICVVAVILAVVIAAGMIVIRNSLISRSDAKEIALADAGLHESDVSALRARLEFDDGRFEYEVSFYNDGVEYDYLIQARDGDIIERDIEGNGRTFQPSGSSGQPDSSEPVQDNASSVTGPDQEAASQTISLDEAKAMVLSDAGVSETKAAFTKEKTDYDNGIQVYDIEFYTSDAEYEYEINVSDGTIYEKNIEPFPVRSDGSAGSGAGQTDDTYIEAGRAKEIALADAGLSESDVRFDRTELDRDHGRAAYEVEFYYDRTEYSYTIDAVTGEIIEYDTDRG